MTSERITIFNQAPGGLFTDYVAALCKRGAICTVFVGEDRGKIDLPPGTIVKTGRSLNRKSVGTRFSTWLTYSLQAVPYLLTRDSKERVVLFSNPPVLIFFVWFCSLIRGFSYSTIIYDTYPDVLTAMGFGGPAGILVKIWRILNRLAYERAFAVITIGDVMAAVIAKQFDSRRTAAGKVLVSRTWVNTSLIRPRSQAENPFISKHKLAARMTALYSGNMGVAHDLETILGAARLLADSPEIEFLLIGSGSGFPAIQTAAKTMSNVKVLPWQPEEDLPLIWASAQVAFSSQKPGTEQCAFPSKTAFALSAGCAVVALTGRPSDLAEIVERNRCGEVVSMGDSEALANCLRTLLANPELLREYRENARRTALDFFTPEKNIALLIAGTPGSVAQTREAFAATSLPHDLP